MRVLLIDNYDSFTFNIVELLRKFPDVEIQLMKNDQDILNEQIDFDKAILSPGPNLPHRSGKLMEFISKYYEQKPMLGICLGHQALALHFGAKLLNFKTPRHGERAFIHQTTQSKLFDKIPKEFYVGLYHSWYVSDENFPKELKITSCSHSNIIMSFEHKQLPLFGVQFHPESYMSEYGPELMKFFLF